MRCDVLIGIDCEYYCFVVYNVVSSGILLPAFDKLPDYMVSSQK